MNISKLVRPFVVLLWVAAFLLIVAWDPLPVKNDRKVFMPGSQPGSANLESVTRCDNCHGGYAQATEPAYNWRGSMMSHAARDPLWLATLTVALQDSVWALGNPNAGDLCIRCHTPQGWLGGRSDPTNTTALTGSDFEGVTCDFCHRSVDPFNALRQGRGDVPAETSAGTAESDRTYAADLSVLSPLLLFDGTSFFNTVTRLPNHFATGLMPDYVESTGGQFFVDATTDKRGPRYDAAPRHTWYYSRWHKSKYFCGTCHDVSNPALANVVLGAGTPEVQAAGSYFHVERTFSEFMLSAYGASGGSATNPGMAVPWAAKCQDCHMRPVTGAACNKAGVQVRSDLAFHDQTGGNTWLSRILASADTSAAGYDAYNYAILSGTKYPSAKVDVAGLQGYGAALIDGSARALQQLQIAATLQLVSDDASTATLRIINNTGHKLISGYPEGRRLFLNVKFYDAGGSLVSEINPYQPLVTSKDGSGNEQYVSGGILTKNRDDLVYEAHMQSSLTGEDHTFHFVLGTGRAKDNRIPPKGFDIANAPARLVVPVRDGTADASYFTAAEYSGGYDEVTITKPVGTAAWTASLYYQTTSKEYMEFLRGEIAGTASSLVSPTPSGETNAYIAQTDAFFGSLKDWGKAMWDLWLHNGGSAPILMEQLSSGPPMPSLSIDNATVTEGDSGTVNISFPVNLSIASGSTVTVVATTSNGTAVAGADYTARSATLTFSPGETSKPFDISVTGDTLNEFNETFSVTLSSPATATISDGLAVGTITDQDPLPSLTIGDVAITEGNAGSTNATFTISLTPASGRTVNVDYLTNAVLATPGVDYTSVMGTAQFTAGQTSKTISVPILGDTLDERDETFTVDLSNETYAILADSWGVGTIVDDDPLPSLSIADVTVSEGNSGTANATFTVALLPQSGRSVTVNFATVDGTASSPTDFTPTSGTLTFNAGETSQQIVVPILGDTADEPDETLSVDLSGVTNATIADATATGTITDDDPLPALSIDDVTVTEGNSGTTNATFIVTLTPASGRTVTASYATANGTAVAGADYTAASGTVTFNAGETTKSISVPILGDTPDEADETFTITLTTPTNATVSDPSGIATISDDDALPALSVNDATVTEGNSGTTPAPFTVTLTPASGRAVSVSYATSDDSATAGADYSASSGTLTLNAGETTKQIIVGILGDTTDEPDETFALTLSSPFAATTSDASGLGTITDDDATPVAGALQFNSATYTTGESGTATVTVTRAGGSDGTVTVNYATANGTAGASDYTPASGTLTFVAGDVSETFTVPIRGDTLDEDDESIDLTLSAPTGGASLGISMATMTITDDDPMPALSINDVTATEGNSGTTNGTFTVTLTPLSGRVVTVNYSTSAGTATAGGDYSTTSGTLTFNPGDTTKTIVVPIVGDTTDEPNETFAVALATPTNATIGDGSGTGTITDDDATPVAGTLQFSAAAYAAGETGVATITVTRSGGSDGSETVNYATADGSATAGADYTPASGTLTFVNGDVSETFTVPILTDALDEADETIHLSLSTVGGGASLGTSSATLTITDDDPLPSLNIGDTTVIEGNSGTTNATFTVTLAPASGRPVSVAYATSNGTATAGTDYTTASGTLTFNAGETTKTVAITIVGDTSDEPDETYIVTLSAPTNATISDASGIGTITDDDTTPVAGSLHFDAATYMTGESGSATITVTRSGGSDGTVTVSYSTANGTAAAGTDYTAASGTLAFVDGDVSETFTVPILPDSLDEGDETIQLALSSPGGGASLGTAAATLTITDDDPLPSLSINDRTVPEGNSGSTSVTFTVTLAPASGRTVTVNFTTSNVSATAGQDYTLANGTLTFNAGETSKIVTVSILGDVLDEPHETFAVMLSSATNAAIGDAAGVCTITDDDATPVAGALQFSSATYTTGEGGAVTITVTRSGGSDGTVTVNYSTSDGSATAGTDYTAASGVLTFIAGDVSEEFTVTIAGDALDENDETIQLTLASPGGGASLGVSTATLSITDDDASPVISIADATSTEGNSGTTNTAFNVTLSVASGRSLTVDYATSNGSAIAGTDYSKAAGTITFSAGQTTKTIAVGIVGDTADEADETFTVTLTNAVNATIGDAVAIGNITDDDSPPTLSIHDLAVGESDAAATFTVTLAPASGRTVTVAYATSNRTATAGADYSPAAATLTFNPGDTTKTISVPILGDSADEADETFTLMLSSPVNANISYASGLGTIVDDDPLPALSVNDVVVTEGNSGSSNASFSVTLSPASGRTVSVIFTTSNGTALAGADYVTESGTLTFNAGQTSKTIAVPILGDTADEMDETFAIMLSSATNASISDATGLGTITDDDATSIDPNGDGTLSVLDVFYLINYLFADGPAPASIGAGDANGNGVLDPADVVWLINALFKH